ncbi:MAG: FAD-dependent oxidoreductase [Bacteroidota bacterium]
MDFSPLFQPIRIGPVTAPNRFYQVPHCNGFGWRMPRGHAAMRAVKAEGGWGVVCTEEVEIHHSTDLSPFFEGRLWDDADIPALALMADAVHKYGALAGIELTYSGRGACNLSSRTPALGAASMGITGGTGYEPGQARAATRDDLHQIRKWHRSAALRAKQAGFDIIYVYAAHGLSLAMHLLSRANDRADEYGGALTNRVRFLRELIEDTREAVGEKCAVAVRLAVDELMGPAGLEAQGEAREIIGLLADMPDLWDVNLSGWSNDSATSRFEKQGFQERYTSFVKEITTRPVVGVGRYTSPDAMLSAIQRGVLDLIGAARPSIADPFLPTKIREGRLEDIRECIGCNICVTGDTRFVPLRCTQNPTMGEEWRRGWHPERVPARKTTKQVLVVGAGPAGLEAACTLGQRGYEVALTEAAREPGGRVRLESQLPGLSEWRRVVDWRLAQIAKLANVSVYPGSRMYPGDVLEAGIKDVLVATGATYRRDGLGRSLRTALPGCEGDQVFTPDDLMEIAARGADLPGAFQEEDARVLIYDDDHYYMGGVLAEFLARQGCRVTIVTPAPSISYWTQFTLEQDRIHARLLHLGVTLLPHKMLVRIETGQAIVRHMLSHAETCIPAGAVVLVTDRLPDDSLHRELLPALEAGRLASLRLIGDAEAPNIIAQAVFSGHLAAREFDEPRMEGTPFQVERPTI